MDAGHLGQNGPHPGLEVFNCGSYVLIDDGSANLVQMLEVAFGCASWNHLATGKAEVLSFRAGLQTVRLDSWIYSRNYFLLVI